MIRYFFLSSLTIQLILNIIQLPFRLKIHFLCWESSRAVDVDVAVNIFRTLFSSDNWLLNKFLSNLNDIISILNIVFCEFYLRISNKEDNLRELIISLCATSMLTLACRVAIATAFSISMHDPAVLKAARRAGLSKWDLEVLPTFFYSKKEDVNNEECSICLGQFDLGEMLISLPCDKKHSFHAACIRQWLERQNSCPLCQKMV